MTAAVDYPVLPSDAHIETKTGVAVQLQNLGQAAAARVALREEKLTELEIRGDVKPATILNRGPFELKVETGLWSYTCKPRPFDKPFSFLTVVNPICVPIYKGNQEMSDRSLQQRYDMKVLLPCHQLMEFKHWYVGESDEDKTLKQGGIVVFEGAMQGVTGATTVRVPEFVYRKGKRYLRFTDGVLKDLIAEQDEQMYHHFATVMDDAGHDWEQPEKRRNITRYHHTVADFMLAMKRIQQAPPWRSAQIQAKDMCKRCGAQYVSATGVCKCGYVHDPFTAYMTSEITADHVRMNSLSSEEWVKVNVEEKRRAEARGGKAPTA